MKRTRKKRPARQPAVPTGLPYQKAVTNTAALMPEGSDSPLTFPCEITVKVMGKANAAFADALIRITQEHYPDLPKAAITKRTSSGGKFWSYSVRVLALSRAEIDAYFRDLTADEQVLMVI